MRGTTNAALSMGFDGAHALEGEGSTHVMCSGSCCVEAAGEGDNGAAGAALGCTGRKGDAGVWAGLRLARGLLSHAVDAASASKVKSPTKEEPRARSAAMSCEIRLLACPRPA
jgi:hypothetical protein